MNLRTDLGEPEAQPQTEANKPLVGPEELAAFEPAKALGEPGDYPYTRGIHREMYRKRLWTMRQFAGFGSADQANQRLQ